MTPGIEALRSCSNAWRTSFSVSSGASSNSSRTRTMRAESPRGTISIKSQTWFERRTDLRPDIFQDASSAAEFCGETASATFSTCSLISCTFGCTSRIKSCSASESRSMRVVISCNSFNIVSWRDEMRCIHQKQTHQQPRPAQVSVNRIILLCPRRFDLDVDRNCLANPGDSFRALTEHQIKLPALERLGCHAPTRLFTFARDRVEQFYMQGDRLCYAVHGEIADNIAAFLAGSLHIAALESDLRIFFDVEKLQAAQMIIAFCNSGVDAAHINSRNHRGIFGMLPVDVDLAIELHELAVGGSDELVNGKPNCRSRLIKFINLVRQRRRTERSCQN